MPLTEILTSAGLLPFEIAFGIVVGLLLLEIVLNFLGLSALGGDGADTELDLEADIDFGPDVDGELGDLGEVELPETEIDMPPAASASGGGWLSWLGLGAVPTTIWLASVLTGFSLMGYALQLAAGWTTGAVLPGSLAALIAAVPGLWLGRTVAHGIGRLIPKTQTTAISQRSYGRRRAVITVGTATAEKAAQVRFTDHHGNMHYAMVTPLDPKDRFPQGTEVLLVRVRDGLKAVAVSD